MVGKRGLGILGVLSAIAGLGVASSTQAQPIVGVPHDWQMDFPPAYTPLMEKVESLNDLLLVIISLICAFVAAADHLRGVALPRLAQSGADDDHAQHRSSRSPGRFSPF